MTRSLLALLGLALAAGACASDNPPGPTLEGEAPAVDGDLAPEGTLQPGADLAPEPDLTPEPGLVPEPTVQPDTARAPGAPPS